MFSEDVAHLVEFVRSLKYGDITVIHTMQIYHSLYSSIISPEALFMAWGDFKKGKQSRNDVQVFETNLEQNIFMLHRELHARSYRHGHYHTFTIRDPKQRRIAKATVKDRIVHHAVFSVLNPIFERTFIADSYSCRTGKGTHKGVDTLERMLWKVSKSFTGQCFALQCDVDKFFDSVSHNRLMSLLQQRVGDHDTVRLLKEIIWSYHSARNKFCGLPIGNLTSQLFANIYLNELDHFIKHKLRVSHYVRYTDDFVIVSGCSSYLESLITPLQDFLQRDLCLSLHPRKVTIRKYRQGIDFLGYVLLPHHRRLRTRTKKRMFRKLQEKIACYRAGLHEGKSVEQSLQSYLGVLSHANTYGLRQKLLNRYWLWM